MLKVLMLAFSLVLLNSNYAVANDSCRIFLNDKNIYNGPVDQENATAFIQSGKFNKSDCIKIDYTSETDTNGWNRTFYINGTNDVTLTTLELGKQTGSVCVRASVLNKMRTNKEPVYIYTISLPTDKDLAERVRVRRIFICKVEWN